MGVSHEPPVDADIHRSVVDQNAKLKKSLRVNKNATVRAVLEELGIEPCKKLIELANATNEDGTLRCSVDQQIKIWTELLSYQQPKLKSVEHSGLVQQEMTIVLRKFDAPAEGKVINITPAMPKSLTAAEGELKEASGD